VPRGLTTACSALCPAKSTVSGGATKRPRANVVTSRAPAARWSALEGMQTADEERRLSALENFLQGYYHALERYARYQFRLEADPARELVHEFILNRLLRRNLLAQADRQRGRFRTFLVQSLNRFVIDELRKGRAAKRAPDQPLAGLAELPPEALDHLSESAHDRFDLEFARGVVHQALTRMRARCEATNRKDLWRVFHDRVLQESFEAQRPLPYDQLTPLLDVRTHAQAANLLTTAKRMFVRVFKSVVEDYEADEEALEGEIKALRYILSNN